MYGLMGVLVKLCVFLHWQQDCCRKCPAKTIVCILLAVVEVRHELLGRLLLLLLLLLFGSTLLLQWALDLDTRKLYI